MTRTNAREIVAQLVYEMGFRDDDARTLVREHLDPDYYATLAWGEDEILPWDVIDVGIRKEYLLRERRRAKEGLTTPDCRQQCGGCGAASLLEEGRCDA